MTTGRYEHHIPVLLEEVRRYSVVKPSEIWVDCTLGFGGHAESLLNDGATVIGIDQDPETLANTKARLKHFGPKIRFALGNFRDLPALLERLGIERVSGILADLGVSSRQLDADHRGFSFGKEGPIDMRMSSDGETAEALIERLATQELARIIKRYGEERFAFPIAKAIHDWFRQCSTRTTTGLAAVIANAIPAKHRRLRHHHPATKTFQALRIEVNDELGALEALLEAAPQHLVGGGRLLVISFHSLEDRIVKRCFKGWGGAHQPARGSAVPLPSTTPSIAKLLTPKPIIATQEELALNSRARSAKLRAVQFLGSAA